jgi:hypothetical protein
MWIRSPSSVVSAANELGSRIALWLQTILLIATAMFVCVLPSNSAAAVYKCEGPKGVVYSDRPCGAGAKVVVSDPKARAANKAKEERLDWMKICGTGDQQACIAAHRQTDAFGAQTKPVDSAQPIQLLLDLRTSCRQKDLTTWFSLHTNKVEQLLKSEDPIRQRQIFERYCGQLGALMARLKDGNPAFATYYTKEVPVVRTGDVKLSLCIVPNGKAPPNCDLQFDVAQEDSVMKRDEL